jgi:hypothetical protein
MTEADQLFDNSAAAELLSISTRHLARLREAGLIQTVRISQSRRGIRYSRRAIEEVMASQTQQGSGAVSSVRSAEVQR